MIPKTPVPEMARPHFIAFVAALMALNALAIDVMLPALPYMGEALGIADDNHRHFVLTAYMLGFGAAQLAYGPISDRFGRRIPLIFGLCVYVLAALAAVAAPNFATLLVLRFVQGLGAAGTRVIATALVRDRYQGRAMAEVMSLAFMVFMIVPVVAPGLGQVLLLVAPWQSIFVFMGGLGALVTAWAVLRLPETLDPAHRRALRPAVVIEGFRAVFAHRLALGYGLSAMFVFGAFFSFLTTAQQIFVDIYGLGALFPLAFAGAATLQALSAFLNSRIVRHFGMRRVGHFALLGFILVSVIWLALALAGPVSFWVFFALLGGVCFMFGWVVANFNALAMEPLGAVAGTASAVFGFLQTAGGAVLGTLIGQNFDGTLVPIAAGFLVMGALSLVLVLLAERGRLFGPGEAYRRAA